LANSFLLARRFAGEALVFSQKVVNLGAGEPPQAISELRSPDQFQFEQANEFAASIVSYKTFETKKTKRSGGKSAEDRAHIEALRDAERVYKDTRTELEAFNIEVDRLNKLQKGGYLSTDTHTRAVEALKDEYTGASQAIRAMESTAESTFAAIVTRAETAREAVSNLAASFAQMAAQSAFKGAFGGVFDGLAGLFGGGKAAPKIPSFDGGGRTGNGPRSGGADGKGGFLALMHPKERVIDETMGGGMGNVFAPVIHASGADKAAIDGVRAELRAIYENFNAMSYGAMRMAPTKRQLG